MQTKQDLGNAVYLEQENIREYQYAIEILEKLEAISTPVE